MNKIAYIFAFLSSYFVSISGHGYLLDPPARSTAWLVDTAFKQCCTYPNHMEMFCGGIQHQWSVHGGKCSICGEPYDRPNKQFERGGSMYLGKIVKSYKQGQIVDVTVVLTANHKGYFEFRICSLDSTPDSEATQQCLDRRLLKIAGTDSTRFRDVGQYGSQSIKVPVQLPADLSCHHCVFQWKYTTGNNWGTDPITGQSGIGLGIENETFMGCADISIGTNGSPTATQPPVVVATTTATFTTQAPKPVTTPQVPQTTARPSTGVTTWSPNGINYKAGDRVLYEGVTYQCVANHTSFTGAHPSPITWAWWSRVN